MDLKTGGPAHHDITRVSSEQAQQGVTQIIELGILQILVLRQTFFVNFTPDTPSPSFRQQLEVSLDNVSKYRNPSSPPCLLEVIIIL